MKNFLKSASAFVLMLGAAVMLFTACDKKGGNSGGNGDVDKTKLEALIIECEALLDGATADDYPEANIEAFTNAVNDAKAIRDNQNATQSQVDLMTNNLTLAKETFVGSKYESIPDSSVIAFFDFETINDNTVASTGTKPVVGVLQAGPAEIFGSDTELPSLVDGVGAGKAIYFSKGNYLAVEDYNPADFLMNNMSWSAWVKVDDASRANNYIVSLNYWNNWKLLGAVAISLAVLLAAVQIPALQLIFDTVRLTKLQWGVSLLCSFAVPIFASFYQIIQKRTKKEQ